MRRTLTKKEIDNIFETAPDQTVACVELYKLAFPDWDNITSINPWPLIGNEAGLYIMGKFMEFDRKHHPNVMNGGLWMNKGFSHLNSEQQKYKLGAWELTTDNCKVERTTDTPATPPRTRRATRRKAA